MKESIKSYRAAVIPWMVLGIQVLAKFITLLARKFMLNISNIILLLQWNLTSLRAVQCIFNIWRFATTLYWRGDNYQVNVRLWNVHKVGILFADFRKYLMYNFLFTFLVFEIWFFHFILLYKKYTLWIFIFIYYMFGYKTAL